MIDRRILRTLININDLPTLPAVMHRILSTIEDDNSSAQDLTELIECDHSISARVLRLANSAFYGLRQQVESIRHAIVVIGFDSISQLALGTSVLDAFSRHQQFALDAEDFWMHSMGTAKASQMLSKRYSDRLETSDDCFTAGLLHGIGKYLLALSVGEDYQAVLAEAAQTERLLIEVEREHLKTDHPEIGAWLAKKWRFPDLMTHVISDLYRPPSEPGPAKVEIAIVALARDLARAAGYGHGGENHPHPYAAETIGLLNIDSNTLIGMIEELRELREETAGFLGIASA